VRYPFLGTRRSRQTQWAGLCRQRQRRSASPQFLARFSGVSAVFGTEADGLLITSSMTFRRISRPGQPEDLIRLIGPKMAVLVDPISRRRARSSLRDRRPEGGCLECASSGRECRFPRSTCGHQMSGTVCKPWLGSNGVQDALRIPLRHQPLNATRSGHFYYPVCDLGCTRLDAEQHSRQAALASISQR